MEGMTWREWLLQGTPDDNAELARVVAAGELFPHRNVPWDEPITAEQAEHLRECAPEIRYWTELWDAQDMEENL